MPEPAAILEPPQFDGAFRRQFEMLLRWRRDVRRFSTEPVNESLLDDILRLAVLAPSVGNSQPWRFVKVDDADRRAGVRRIFAACNEDALAAYHGARAKLYAELKLSGLDRAPVHLAVFADEATRLGAGLGRKTMPETLAYSVVGAIQTLWLAARAHGVGIGWVSILKPDGVHALLEVPATWSLVAYLCLGYPEEEHMDPELERCGWQPRVDPATFVIQR